MPSADASKPAPALEPATQQFIDEVAADAWHLLESPAEARAAFTRLQSGPVGKPGVRIEDTSFPAGPAGAVPVRITWPGETGVPPHVLVYCPGGRWVGGDADTHDRLIREIVAGTGAAVVAVGYDRAPEAQYPLAIEQAYAATAYVAVHAQELGLDNTCLAIAGDCAGATIATVVTLLARERRGPKINLQVLVCPVVDADFSTPSYGLFADGPWLTRAAMQRAWDAYLPDVSRRGEITAAPLRASLEQLINLPDALVIVAENDVTRDEAECYAQKLSDAGGRVTSVRYNGTIHDFVVLNALADTPAARAAIAQIISALNAIFI